MSFKTLILYIEPQNLSLSSMLALRSGFFWMESSCGFIIIFFPSIFLTTVIAVAPDWYRMTRWTRVGTSKLANECSKVHAQSAPRETS